MMTFRLCLRFHGDVVLSDDGLSIRAIGRDSWVVLESEERRPAPLIITEGPGGLEHEWSVNGREASFDARRESLARSDVHGAAGLLGGQPAPGTAEQPSRPDLVRQGPCQQPPGRDFIRTGTREQPRWTDLVLPGTRQQPEGRDLLETGRISSLRSALPVLVERRDSRSAGGGDSRGRGKRSGSSSARSKSTIWQVGSRRSRAEKEAFDIEGRVSANPA